jgi:hypothetical protein
MKQVISYSLYGDKQMYLAGALKNVALAQKIYPEFMVRFYVSNDVPQWLVDTLGQFNNVEIRKSPENNPWLSSAWRFLAFADPEVDLVLVRDADARLTVRERRAVDDWMDSQLDFHVMKDHPNHNRWPISAGMWGGWADKLRNMSTLLGVYIQEKGEQPTYIADQLFLNDKLKDRVLRSCMMHDAYFDTELSRPSVRKRFPTKLHNPANHVGAALDENDYFRFSGDEGLSVINGGSGRFEYDLDLLEEY